ncbi:peptidase M36, partial [Obelidium mucronatum]
RGIRWYPYSTNLTTNPHLYGDLKTLNEVHNMGEVWAAMLYDILWNMVDVAGITPAANIGKQNKGTAGNTALLKILVAGMKIQPCNPSVIQARDAIIVAENVLYKGKFKCAIWKGFAKRGLGINADEMFTNSMDIPEDC